MTHAPSVVNHDTRPILLKVEGLSSGYGSTQVLWGIDLEVRSGEAVALIGANGAGKTTLLRALAGQLPATEGRVLLDDRDITTVPAHQRVQLGAVMVPEGRQLFAGMTVTENLVMGAYTRRDNDIASDLERVRELFPILGERSKQLAGHLSGGEQQMVAIGRALMAKPRLLMIDELSLGLAPVVMDRIVETVAQIHQSGLTLLIVEQDIVNATTMAQRGYVMESGRILFEGASADLLKDPRVQEAFIGI